MVFQKFLHLLIQQFSSSTSWKSKLISLFICLKTWDFCSFLISLHPVTQVETCLLIKFIPSQSEKQLENHWIIICQVNDRYTCVKPLLMLRLKKRGIFTFPTFVNGLTEQIGCWSLGIILLKKKTISFLKLFAEKLTLANFKLSTCSLQPHLHLLNSSWKCFEGKCNQLSFYQPFLHCCCH